MFRVIRSSSFLGKVAVVSIVRKTFQAMTFNRMEENGSRIRRVMNKERNARAIKEKQKGGALWRTECWSEFF